MLVNLHVSRRFTSGTLEGLTIPQVIARIDSSRAGKVGDTFTCKRAFGGGSYVDTVTAIEQA